jgi:ABC-type nitrate/sulfonate/bicarbonate transport system substrate-binding protein
VVAGRDARVRSVADLAGRRVAIDALNSLPHLALVEALRRSGVSPGGVRFVEIPFAQMLQPLARANVDAAVLPEPFLTIGLSQGAKRVESVFDAVCSRPCLLTAWIAQAGWAEENRETVARFRRAIESASGWANEPEKRRDSGAMLRRYAPIDERVLSRMTRATFAERLEPQLAQPWIDALARNRAIPEPFEAVELTR